MRIAGPRCTVMVRADRFGAHHASRALGRVGLARVLRISGASCAKIHAEAAVMIPTQMNVAWNAGSVLRHGAQHAVNVASSAPRP